MSAVWVVRDAEGNVVEVTFNQRTKSMVFPRHTIECHELLTPEHERVIAAAKAHAARPSLATEQVLIGYVDALRAQEGA